MTRGRTWKNVNPSDTEKIKEYLLNKSMQAFAGGKNVFTTYL